MSVKVIVSLLLILVAASRLQRHGGNRSIITGSTYDAPVNLVSPDDEDATPKVSQSSSIKIKVSRKKQTRLSSRDDRKLANIPSVRKKAPIVKTKKAKLPKGNVTEILSSEDEESQSTVNASSFTVLTLPADLANRKRFTRSDFDTISVHLLSQLESSTPKIDLPLLPDENPSFRRQIDRDQFRNLLASECINDQVVGAYFKQLLSLDTSGVYSVIDPAWIEKLHKNFKFEQGKVYLWPIHHREDFHWTLLVIGLQNEKMVLNHYDSIKSKTPRSGMKMAAKILKEKLEIKGKLPCEQKSTPQQDNGVDCGIFISEIGKRIVLGRPIDSKLLWNGATMRKIMAMELVGRKLATRRSR